MNWFKKIFQPIAKPAGDMGKRPAREESPALARPPEARSMHKQNIAAWCDRLEREAQRTGNRRMLAQARNIRAEWGL